MPVGNRKFHRNRITFNRNSVAFRVSFFPFLGLVHMVMLKNLQINSKQFHFLFTVRASDTHSAATQVDPHTRMWIVYIPFSVCYFYDGFVIHPDFWTLNDVQIKVWNRFGFWPIFFSILFLIWTCVDDNQIRNYYPIPFELQPNRNPFGIRFWNVRTACRCKYASWIFYRNSECSKWKSCSTWSISLLWC